MSLLKVVAHFETTLVNAIDENSTTMELESIVTPAGEIPDGSYGFTIEQESNSKREYVIGTLNGTTVTFTKRDVSPLDGTTANASGDTQRKRHRKGVNIKFTDHPALISLVRLLDGTDELDPTNRLTYSGTVTPTDDNELVTKAYVLSVITGGTVTYDSQILSGDAGESIASGNYLYFKESDGKWYKFDADEPTHVSAKIKGFAKGAGSINGLIANGIQVSGLEKTGSYTAGTVYYASNTPGVIDDDPGTNSYIIGVGDNNGYLVMVDAYKLTSPLFAALNAAASPSASNPFVTRNEALTDVQTFTANGTWTKPAGAKMVEVVLIGGGQGGTGGQSSSSGGGGRLGGAGGAGGALSTLLIDASLLPSTVAVTVGAGGAGGAGGVTSSSPTNGVAGANGGNTTFGTYLAANGGNGGVGGTGEYQGGTGRGAGNGGGGGNSGSNTNTTYQGNAGGSVTYPAAAGGAFGTGSNGSDGASSPIGFPGGGGGGSGWGPNQGYTGGAGGLYGGGGGGGAGAAGSGFNGGNGGSGAAGIARIVTYF